MIIAFASGKGGTGKTTFSAAFALSSGEDVTFLDCDVEEPDSHFFLKPVITGDKKITVLVPELDSTKCSGCGRCAAVCRFNAVTMVGSKPLFFPELCHSCGGCSIACPEDAIHETGKVIGTIISGKNRNINFFQGRLNIGNAMSPPLIRAVKKENIDSGLVIIDSPPGTSCPMVTSLNNADYAVLVTEPTPFGLNDLKLAVDTIRKLKLPFGVIINKADLPFSGTEEYCRLQSIKILLKVNESRAAAEGYSRGMSIIEIHPELSIKISEVIEQIKKETLKEVVK